MNSWDSWLNSSLCRLRSDICWFYHAVQLLISFSHILFFKNPKSPFLQDSNRSISQIPTKSRRKTVGKFKTKTKIGNTSCWYCLKRENKTNKIAHTHSKTCRPILSFYYRRRVRKKERKKRNENIPIHLNNRILVFLAISLCPHSPSFDFYTLRWISATKETCSNK